MTEKTFFFFFFLKLSFSELYKNSCYRRKNCLRTTYRELSISLRECLSLYIVPKYSYLEVYSQVERRKRPVRVRLRRGREASNGRMYSLDSCSLGSRVQKRIASTSLSRGAVVSRYRLCPFLLSLPLDSLPPFLSLDLGSPRLLYHASVSETSFSYDAAASHIGPEPLI